LKTAYKETEKDGKKKRRKKKLAYRKLSGQKKGEKKTVTIKIHSGAKVCWPRNGEKTHQEKGRHATNPGGEEHGIRGGVYEPDTQVRKETCQIVGGGALGGGIEKRAE